MKVITGNDAEPAEPTELPGRPSWASDRLVDESLIEYSHPIGSVATCGDDPSFDVVIIQQDELDLDADPPKMTRHEPEIWLAGIRITEDQTSELSEVLARAVRFVRTVAAAE